MAQLAQRWQETQLLQAVPSASRPVRVSRPPGSHARFESRDVALLLHDTEVIGTGPTGPSVTLDLALRFKPESAGRTFVVEMKAADDSGSVQGWDQVGRITVQRAHHGHR